MPPPLSVDMESLPRSQVGLTIEVPAEVVDATYEKVIKRLVAKAKIEGFRPGKAPRALVEARVGPAALREEVVDVMVPEVMRDALVEKSLDPIDNPDVEVLELERGRPARLKATVSVMPDVTLGDAKALTVESPTVEVDDAMLERRLESVREPLAEITPVEREVRTGDIIVVDVEVQADGEVVASETRRAMEAEVKEGVLLPELLAVLPGAFVDEIRSAVVSFPENYSEPKLAGREATIQFTIRGVKEKVLPELDDELAKQLSDGKQETVEAYRAEVRRQLEEQASAMAQLAREQAVVKALVEASTVDIPEALADRELASQLETLERRLGEQGLRLDRYMAYLGKTLEQWVAEERPDAEARLKVDLVLAEFAKREGLDPTDDEIAAYIEEQASADDELKGQVAELKKSASARRYFASRLRRLRTLERLVEVVGPVPAKTK